MIVPEYWAEAVIKYKKDNKKATIKRFGWSDSSQQDAQLEAQKRADEALQQWLNGKLINFIEHKVRYNGADGLPIREQILSRHKDVVITRNSYGAHCLNSPDVMFADIDFYDLGNGGGCFVPFLYFLLFGATVVSGIKEQYQLAPIFVGAIFLLFMVRKIIGLFTKPLCSSDKGVKQKAIDKSLEKITAFLQQNPKWGIRVYETPAGLRLLVTHKVMNPNDNEVTLFFDKMVVDSIYARMCKNQQCFRARVSPKPWRIGMDAHIRPSPGIWPINPQYMAVRQQWLTEYEEKANKYASCRFLKALGNEKIDTKVSEVIVLHDKLSKAHSDLPIA